LLDERAARNVRAKKRDFLRSLRPREGYQTPPRPSRSPFFCVLGAPAPASPACAVMQGGGASWRVCQWDLFGPFWNAPAPQCLRSSVLDGGSRRPPPCSSNDLEPSHLHSTLGQTEPRHAPRAPPPARNRSPGPCGWYGQPSNPRACPWSWQTAWNCFAANLRWGERLLPRLRAFGPPPFLFPQQHMAPA